MSEENIALLLNDKDSENTKKPTKQHRLIFLILPQGKKQQKSHNCSGFSGSFGNVSVVLRKFYAQARK